MERRSLRRALSKIRSVRFNQNLMTFGFFLFLSALFWFFNALNKEYYIDLMVPVKYINLPDNKLQVGDASNYVKVSVSAYGYLVVDYKTSNIKPILIDYRDLSSKSIPGTKKKTFYIVTSSFRDQILDALGPKLRINKIMPDTLFVDLLKVVSKKVPVKSNFLIQCRKQFMLSDSVVFMPDSVIIKGLETALDTIKAIYTERKIIEDFHDSTDFEVKLQEIDGTELNTNTVYTLIRAEQYTEIEYKLPVYILNEPIGYSVKLFPSEVRVLFNTGFKNYHKITSDQFRIVVDYLELEASKSSRALLHLNKKPDKISNIRIYPQSVDYIIEKYD